MVIRDDFILLKNVPNLINLNKNEIKKYEDSEAKDIIVRSMNIKEKRINHFTKNRVFEIINKDALEVVNVENYLLPVSYNKNTHNIILNMSALPFQKKDATKIDSREFYAAIVYGYTMKAMVENKIDFKTQYFGCISNYMLSLFVKMFGKDYGLIGVYSTEIPWLKFWLTCYVLKSMFGLNDLKKIYDLASVVSSVDYRANLEKIKDMKFDNLEDLINTLNKSGTLPNFDKYKFSAKIIRSMSVNCIPSFEDLARFMAMMTTSSISGSSVIPTYIKSFNMDEYEKILEISKLLFR